MELFLKYGTETWRSGNELTMAILESVTREAQLIKEEIDMINKKRKLSQVKKIKVKKRKIKQ